ncbi:IS3 family transposase [Streptomyces aculeolatus]
MGKKTRPRRSFTPEFKAEIVELCRRGDRSVGQVAKDFELTETAVRLWVSQAEVDAGEKVGLSTDEREELARLRRGEPPAAAGCGGPQAGHGFLREGDPVTVHPFIQAEKRAGHSVKRACELLQVSRAAFYARRADVPGPRAVRDAELAAQISRVHARSRGAYGAPRVHAALQREGIGCGRRRVARLMRRGGLAGRHRRRRARTTIPDPHAGRRPDLIVRDFTPATSALNRRWCGDITYLPTEEGWLYLATVIDIASRKVVGWATAGHLRTSLVTDALVAVCRSLRPEPG